MMKGLLFLIAVVAVTAQQDQPYMSAAGARAMLKEHNDLRAAVSMPPLQWDGQLAADAWEWAQDCPQDHDYGNLGRLMQGENLYWQQNYESHVKIAFNSLNPNQTGWENWGTERKYYDEASGSCSGVCGHWTQIVWGTTTRVGCAINPCSTQPRGLSQISSSASRSRVGEPYSPDGERGPSPISSGGWLTLVCRYSPPGNYGGRRYNENVAAAPQPQQPTPGRDSDPIPMPPRSQDPVNVDPAPPRVQNPTVEQPPAEPRTPEIPGECPGGRVPPTHYFSGCTATARNRRRTKFRLGCQPPPYPLNTMAAAQIRTMQQYANRALKKRDTSACCQVSARYYCAGPAGGFVQAPVQRQPLASAGGQREPCRIVRTTRNGVTTEERFNC